MTTIPTFARPTRPSRASPARLLTRRGDWFAERFLISLSCLLLGYAIGGRGFAYIGLPPIFVGEMVLLLGVVAFLRSKAWSEALGDAHLWPMLALCGWCAARTVPFFSQFGMAAARDAVVWVYAGFALCAFTILIDRPERLRAFVHGYRTFVPAFLGSILFAFAIYRILGRNRPEWPWAPGVPVVQVKEGDVLVHLAGVLAFWTSGLSKNVTTKWVLLLTFNAALMGVIDRAGMVAFMAVFAFSAAFKPMHSALKGVAVTILLAVAVLWVTDIRIPIYNGKGRQVSFEQVMINLTSVLSDTGNDGLDSTKEWRKDWWKSILAYTFNGNYFWGGKGFGVNLADDDGFQVMADHSLRNPHDVHLTFLARGGVPALALWALTQGAWACTMLGSMLKARRLGQTRWQGLFFFLLAYWGALLINGSFDVFIEGPSGGIWFWVVYGVGLAAQRVHRVAPETFEISDAAFARKEGATA